jgi:predicted nucleic acid-binding Zn ribbon protein
MDEARDGLRRAHEILGSLTRRLGLPDPRKTGAVWGRWEEFVGVEIASHARPSSLRAGVLRVRADSPAWAHELGYLGEEIKGRVNAGLGQPVITEIRVYTAPMERAPGDSPMPEHSARQGPPPAPHEKPPAGPEEALERARNAWIQSQKVQPRRAPGSASKHRK